MHELSKRTIATHDVQLMREPGAKMHKLSKSSTTLNLGTRGPTQCARGKTSAR